MMTRPTASIITVGSELTEGLRLDTNSREIAFALSSAGYHVLETLSVGDEVTVLSDALSRLCARDAVVIVTGGLGPTHDDITREAASHALERPLARDSHLEALLEPAARQHTDARAAEQVLRQADLLEGASAILPTTGTAPGQVIGTATGVLILLPGPPAEMRPMLASVIERLGQATGRATVREIACVGITESDAQVRASRVLTAHPGVGFTILASPADVHVLLLDEGAGEKRLASAASAVADALADHVYSTDGSTLAETTVHAAAERALTIAVAESCTGGMLAASITDVPGASDVFSGGVVAYSNDAKVALLGVSADTLAAHGAVSGETAVEMALGARTRLVADMAVAVTGIAGPAGGTPDKPVGLVWFGVATGEGTRSVSRRFPGDRTGVRTRATIFALDLLRRETLGR